MIVSDAIKLLQKVLREHGDVEVFFDCPRCDQAFTPSKVVTKAVVVSAKVQP